MPSEKIILKPNAKLVTVNEDTIEKSWMDNKLIFRSKRFEAW